MAPLARTCPSRKLASLDFIDVFRTIGDPRPNGTTAPLPTLAVRNHDANTSFLATRNRYPAPSASSVSSERDQTSHRARGSSALVLRGEDLERVAKCAVLCPTADGSTLAATAVPGVLEATQQIGQPRSTANISGIADSDRTDVARQSYLGIAPNRRRTS